MFVIIIKNLRPKWIRGITIFPFIIIRNVNDRKDKVFFNHEKIHFKQQLELFIIIFYLWYLIEFVIHYLRVRDFYKAYMKISFEKEAYKNEKNLDYLKSRSYFEFVKYL